MISNYTLLITADGYDSLPPDVKIELQNLTRQLDNCVREHETLFKQVYPIVGINNPYVYDPDKREERLAIKHEIKQIAKEIHLLTNKILSMWHKYHLVRKKIYDWE